MEMTLKQVLNQQGVVDQSATQLAKKRSYLERQSWVPLIARLVILALKSLLKF